jgi:hypothetical protein
LVVGRPVEIRRILQKALFTRSRPHSGAGAYLKSKSRRTKSAAEEVRYERQIGRNALQKAKDGRAAASNQFSARFA